MMGSNKSRKLYFLFRTLSIMAAILPPSVRAMQLFPVWKEGGTVDVKAGLGFGGILAAVIVIAVFRKTIISNVKKHMGLVGIIGLVLVWLALAGLRKAAPYIANLEQVAFYAVIGAAASWGLSAVALYYKMRGGDTDDGIVDERSDASR